MKYNDTIEAVFLKRINRFAALVSIDGREEKVHVKNTGRLGELLKEGAKVCLQKSGNPARKTAYDLISVWKEGRGWVNIDSQVCNEVIEEYFQTHTSYTVRREVRYGNSRFDFLLDEDIFVEVKGCTLEIDGKGYFPDAPTTRGTRHVRELTAMAWMGREVWIIFVLAVNGLEECLPHAEKDPAFARALQEAAQAGVKIFDAVCQVEKDGMVVTNLKAKKPEESSLLPDPAFG